MSTAVDLGIIVFILGITYAIVSEGLWGAALIFFNVLFSVLIALNFYEPLAALLATNVSALASFADLISLGGIWIVSLVLFKLLTENMAPTLVRFPPLVLQIGRLVFGLAGGTLTVGFVLLLFNVAPVQKKLFNVVGYDHKPPFGMALDRKLLGLMQYTSGSTFPNYGASRSDTDYGNARIFDPTGSWLIDHQNARPFGEGSVPAAEAPPVAGGGGGSGGGNPGASS